MKVVIFEPTSDGHHLPYVRQIVSSLRPLGVRMTLAIEEKAPTSKEWTANIGDSLGDVEIDARFPDEHLAADAPKQRLGLLMETVRRHRPDHLIIPYCDGVGQLLAAASLRFAVRWPREMTSEGLYIRCGYAYPTGSLVRRMRHRMIWQFVKRTPLTRLHHLDPNAFDMIRHDDRWRLMPDPTPIPAPMTHEEARRALDIPVDGRYISSLGLVDSRKGADLLLKAFADAHSARLLAPTDRLLLAGPTSADVRSLIDGPMQQFLHDGRIVCINRYLKLPEIGTAVQASDLVATLYPHDRHIGPSGFVLHAAAGHRPLLAGELGWVGQTTRRFGLGFTAPVYNQTLLMRGLVDALNGAATWQPSHAATRFVRFHAVENCAIAWRGLLRDRMGLPPEHGFVSWESVETAAEPRQDADKGSRYPSSAMPESDRH